MPPRKPKTARAKKKAEPVELSKQEQLALLKHRINSRFGEDIAQSAETDTGVGIIRRPTGLLSLDRWIAGGVQARSLTQFIGKPSSCKSYMADRIIAEAQATYGEDSCIGIAMTEQDYDKLRGKKAGVRIALSDLEIQQQRKAAGRPLTKKEVAYFKDQVGSVEIAKGNAEQILETILEWVRSCLFQVILLDSIGALIPERELEAEEGLSQQFRGGSSVLMTKFIRKLHHAFNQRTSQGYPNCTSLVAINQWRDNVNAGLYGNPLAQSGGHALLHGTGLNILFEAGTKLTQGEGKDKVMTGKEIRWTIIKAKTGCYDGPRGSFSFYFGNDKHEYGADELESLFIAALEHGIIEQQGAWLTLYGENQEPLIRTQGKPKFLDQLRENEGLQESIREAVLEDAKITYLTKAPWE